MKKRAHQMLIRKQIKLVDETYVFKQDNMFKTVNDGNVYLSDYFFCDKKLK